MLPTKPLQSLVAGQDSAHVEFRLAFSLRNCADGASFIAPESFVDFTGLQFDDPLSPRQEDSILQAVRDDAQKCDRP